MFYILAEYFVEPSGHIEKRTTTRAIVPEGVVVVNQHWTIINWQLPNSSLVINWLAVSWFPIFEYNYNSCWLIRGPNNQLMRDAWMVCHFSDINRKRSHRKPGLGNALYVCRIETTHYICLVRQRQRRKMVIRTHIFLWDKKTRKVVIMSYNI